MTRGRVLGVDAGGEQVVVVPVIDTSAAEAATPSDRAFTLEAGQWFVLHTKSRQEKILAADLAAMDIPHYLPVTHQRRQYGTRRVVVEEPLFPGYVFLRGSREQAFSADRTRRVARIIPVVDQRRINWELTNLRIALTSDRGFEPYAYLKKGVRVEVRSGPLMGLQGVIEDRSRFDRLILQVEMLGRAVSLEVDGAILEPID
jgi:transcription antitermination factor NusG